MTVKQQSAPAGDGPDRRSAMESFSKASRAELQQAWDAIAAKPDVAPVRGPETGLVMVRGRIGGGGAPFNLGEVTVTRASVRFPDGTIGHGQTLGTDREKARLAAIFDAMLQVPDLADHARRLATAIALRIDAEDREAARQTAATRVDFFTMVRGED